MPKSIFERLFDSWPEPRMLLEREASGELRVARANPQACEYFSQAPDSLDGKCLSEFLDADNRQHVMRAIDVCFKSSMPVTVQVIPGMQGGVRIRSFFLNPLIENGVVTGLDMGARLPAPGEDALKRERDDAVSIFSSIFDASDVGIVVTDHHRRIVRVNATFCNTYGWEPIDVVGQEFTILIPMDEHDIARQRHDDFDQKAFTEKSRELKIVKKNGELANIIASSGVIELSGSRKFRISTVVDITNLKQIERDLRKAKEEADAASHAKSSFLANMSHELRTPLNAIIGFSDLMLTGTLGPIDNRNYVEYLGDIKFSAGHLLAIINDVLDMSKIEAGHMKLDKKPSDLVALLEDAKRLIYSRAQDGKIDIALDAPSDLCPVAVDQRMFRQVVLNLLSNAVKFSHTGGTVRITIRQDGPDWLSFSVADTGIGIPQDKIQEVLQPFGQVSDPRVAKGQGTGLGLPLARAMMELHGGTLSIDSHVNKGTVVTCRLPCVAAGG